VSPFGRFNQLKLASGGAFQVQMLCMAQDESYWLCRAQKRFCFVRLSALM